MCVTVTRDQRMQNGQYAWGASVNWVGYSGSPQYVLKKGASGLNDIFTKTIDAIGAGVAGSFQSSFQTKCTGLTETGNTGFKSAPFFTDKFSLALFSLFSNLFDIR